MKMRKTDMKLNNRAFSLVELIVVIAIMSVLVGFVSVGTGILSGKAARETRDKLLSSLENVKTQTLGKNAIDASISYDASKKQYILTYSYLKTTVLIDGSKDTSTVTESKTVGTDKCEIYFADNTFSDVITSADDCINYYGSSDIGKIDETTSVSFSFDRSSGALKPYISVGGVDYYIEHIYVVQGAHDPYGIRLYPETGKMTEE